MLGNSVLSSWSAGSLLQCFHMQLLDNTCLLLESPSLSPQLCVEVFVFSNMFHLASLRGFYWLSLLKHTMSKLLQLTCDSLLASSAFRGFSVPASGKVPVLKINSGVPHWKWKGCFLKRKQNIKQSSDTLCGASFNGTSCLIEIALIMGICV